MPTPDYTIYMLHLLFWLVFIVGRLTSKAARRAAVSTASRSSVADVTDVTDARATAARGALSGTTSARVAPYSRVLVIGHGFAFAVMYFGIGNAVFSGAIRASSSTQHGLGAAVIVVGAALAAWALAHFESWRLRAKLDEGHELATGGPFRLVRHPIYGALNLLALGSAIWVSGPAMWIACVVMAIVGDLRGRAEERLLRDAFGSTYGAYCARTRRFLPFVY